MEFAETLINTPITLVKIRCVDPTPIRCVYKIYDKGKSEDCGSIIVYKGNVWGQICLNKTAVMFNYSIGDDKTNDLPSDETIEQTCERIKLEILKKIIKNKESEDDIREEKMTDREKLIELIKEANLSMWGRSGLSSAAERRAYLADYLISKGVKIPVRCGECCYYNENGICCFPNAVQSFYGCKVKENHFCSYGERRGKTE